MSITPSSTDMIHPFRADIDALHKRIEADAKVIAALREAAKPFVDWLHHINATGSRRLADNEYPEVSGWPKMRELRALWHAYEQTAGEKS